MAGACGDAAQPRTATRPHAWLDELCVGVWGHGAGRVCQLRVDFAYRQRIFCEFLASSLACTDTLQMQPTSLHHFALCSF